MVVVMMMIMMRRRIRKDEENEVNLEYKSKEGESAPASETRENSREKRASNLIKE